MIKVSKYYITLGLMLITNLTSIDLWAQNWLEKLDFKYDYNLTGKKILTVVSNNFNYEETIEMSNTWRSFGADVEYTGVSDLVVGENPEFKIPEQKENTEPQLNIKTLLKNINPSNYDVLYIAGGEGIKELVDGNGKTLNDLIGLFYKKRKIIAAICHGPLALSVSNLIFGKKVTANGHDEREALLNAGAIFTDDIIVNDDGFITGQWPFLETFAYTVAEELQFGPIEGPFQTYNESLSNTQRMLRDLRAASELSEESIDEENLKKIIQSAMLTPPIDVGAVGNIPFKLIRINILETKSTIARAVLDKIKDIYTARGIPINEMEKRLKERFITPPNLFIAVIDTTNPRTNNKQLKDNYLRNGIIQYGAARENIVLMSKFHNYSVCFSGFPTFLQAEDEIKKIINVPDNYVLVDMFAIGHAKFLSVPPLSRPLDTIMVDEKFK